MQWLDERAREVRQSIDAVRKIGSELEYLQLGWHPPDGGWSVAQVFEHLILGDASYLPVFRHIIDTGRKGSSPHSPSLLGGFITRSVQPMATRKVTAPRIYKPAPEPRANVVDEYIKVREELLRLIEEASAKGVDVQKNRLSSPVAKIIRMNFGDAVLVLVAHTNRHLGQIARIRSLPGFPARTGATG